MKTKILGMLLFTTISCLNYAVAKASSPHLEVPIYKDGQMTSIGELSKGKPTLLIFWAVDCLHCQREAPDIKDIYARFADEILMLGINTDKEYDALIRIPIFIEKYQFLPPVIKDNKGLIAAHFGVPGTPTLLVLDSQGSIKAKIHSNVKKIIPYLSTLIDKKKEKA